MPRKTSRSEEPSEAESRRVVSRALGRSMAEKTSVRLVHALAAKLSSGNARLAMIMECLDYRPSTWGMSDIDDLTPARLRTVAYIPYAKNAAYAGFAPLRAAMEKTKRSRVGVCWLNSCMKATGDPAACAEVAEDSSIIRIDLPRRVYPEMDIAGVTVGVPFIQQQIGATGHGVQIALIDGEVAIDHPAFTGRATLQANLTTQQFGHPSPHATAVAGICAARDSKFSGVAPDATILNYKLLPTRTRPAADDFDAALAIESALTDGAHVANCSWGTGPAGDGSSREARAFDNAWKLGLIIVKSAGNLGPASNTLTGPGDAQGVIVVAATDRRGENVENYSSRGPAPNGKHPHLCAPGGSPADSLTACMADHATTPFGPVGHGTSFATPMVSGAVALLLEKFPDATPDEIRDKLLRCCRPLSDDINARGAGLLDLTLLSGLETHPGRTEPSVANQSAGSLEVQSAT